MNIYIAFFYAGPVLFILAPNLTPEKSQRGRPSTSLVLLFWTLHKLDYQYYSEHTIRLFYLLNVSFLVFS